MRFSAAVVSSLSHSCFLQPVSTRTVTQCLFVPVLSQCGTSVFPPWGSPLFKRTGIFMISSPGVSQWFWFHIGCSGRNTTIQLQSKCFLGRIKRNNKNPVISVSCVCLFVAFLTRCTILPGVALERFIVLCKFLHFSPRVLPSYLRAFSYVLLGSSAASILSV